MPKSSSVPARDLALLESLWRESIERYTLPNGLTVLLKPDSAAPVSSVQVWVKTGSVHEGAHLGAGLSHYLEHMLFKGTERRAGRDISATVQAHGGYINAYTTFDRTVYYIDVPSDHTAVAIDLLADAVLHSTLPADEVAKEKDVILREIDMCLDDPDQRLSQALFETAFRAHPYREPIIGHRDVFAASTRDDLLAYYRGRYVPNNLVVVIVGDFDPVAVRASVAEHFGKAPRVRLAPVLVPDEPAQLSRRDQHLHEDVQVSRAGLGWQIPGLAHPDAPALDMLAMVLGHGDSSILWQAIREKARLVHSIDAMSWSPGTSGLFYISYLADPGKRVAAEQAILRELDRVVTKGISAAALAKAVRQAVTSEINMRKTMSGQASRLGAGEVVVGDINYTRQYFSRLFALTPILWPRASPSCRPTRPMRPRPPASRRHARPARSISRRSRCPTALACCCSLTTSCPACTSAWHLPGDRCLSPPAAADSIRCSPRCSPRTPPGVPPRRLPGPSRPWAVPSTSFPATTASASALRCCPAMPTLPCN
jgi:zinc protease